MAIHMSAKGEGSNIPEFNIPDSFHLQAIATDVDGTFFASQLHILPSTLEAYKRATALGIKIIPATGRVKEGVEEALQAAGANEVQIYPGVYLNGGTVYGPDGDLILKSTLSENIVEKMVEFEKRVNGRLAPDWQEDPLIKQPELEFGFLPVQDRSLKPAFVSLCGYTCNGIAYVEYNQLIDGMKQFKEGRIIAVDDLLAYSKQFPIYKFLLISHSVTLMEPLRREVKELFGDEVTLNAGIPRILEISPKGVDKSEGLLRVAEHLGIPLHAIACLGDGDNDVGMLKACGYSVAMENAQPFLKEIANAVTKSNDDDGWAMAVHSMLDKKEEDDMAMAEKVLMQRNDFTANVEDREIGENLYCRLVIETIEEETK